MARIRTLKPEFWTDERVGEVSVSARLLFIATWSFADDHGGLDRSAKQLKAQAFPYDTIDCEILIRELLTAGLLIEYDVDGKKYLHIKGFRSHQKVEKPSKPRVPLYEPSVNAPRIVVEPSPGSSGSSLGMEGNGREEAHTRALRSSTTTAVQESPNGEADRRQPSEKAKRGSRIPESFGLTEHMRSWAKSQTPGVDVEAETAEFVDYWHTVPGQKGCKLDWVKTWQVRMRELQRRFGSRKVDAKEAPRNGLPCLNP